MLSKRLTKVANLINEANNVADIGTDHGYLPIFLLKNKKTKYAFAVDINDEPLMEAAKNIKLNNLENKIVTVKSDGLKYFNDKFILLDYVTICGLGSVTILSILQNWESPQSKVVICSNTEISKIRNWSNKNKYLIKKEEFFSDNKKNYWLIFIDVNKKHKIKKKHLLFGNPKFFQNNQEYKNYLMSEINKFEKIVKKMNHKTHKKQIQKIKKQILAKEKFINEISQNS